MTDQRVREIRNRESEPERPELPRNAGGIANADAARATVLGRYREGESVLQLPKDDVPSMGAAIRAQLDDLE